MIIECINCNKVFEVNSELIPENGRNIQCGSCNHVWFYNPKISDSKKEKNQDTKIDDLKKTSLIKTLQKKDLILFIKLISGPQMKVFQVMELS